MLLSYMDIVATTSTILVSFDTMNWVVSARKECEWGKTGNIIAAMEGCCCGHTEPSYLAKMLGDTYFNRFPAFH